MGAAGRRGLLGRLASWANGGAGVASPVASAPSVTPADTKSQNGSTDGPSEPESPSGTGHRFLSQKSTADLLPRLNGIEADFFSPDGGATIIPLHGIGATGLAFTAYWFCAMRWRAQKIAEAPLMVVEEDQDDGSEEWLSDHDLAGVLDSPSPDYDMGELLERTSRYLDTGGEALWVKDLDRGGRVARLTPFARGEFTHVKVTDRLYGRFKVTTATGQTEFDAADVCYFRDAAEGSGNWWGEPRSRLDVAMGWLRLGETARQTVRELLENSVWPSIVFMPDKDWNPDPETFDRYKQELNAYGRRGNKGKAQAMLGGGSATQLAAKIRELVPEEVLNRVESVVAAVSGVPAIVLQFQVGMENSPWSQMEQARRMAYDDTIQPAWRRLERTLTRQLLRPEDDDTTHFIRFDRTTIASLQRDKLEAVQIATTMGKAASLNERRTLMGLEPLDDPKADEVPELTAPSLEQLLAGMNQGGGNQTPNSDGGNAADDSENADTAKSKRPPAPAIVPLERKIRSAALREALRQEAIPTWHVNVQQELHHDAEEIATIVEQFLTDVTPKARRLFDEPDDHAGNGRGVAIRMQVKARGKERVTQAVTAYLKHEGKASWTRRVSPLMARAAERSGAAIAADMNVSYNLLHPNLLKFAQRETGRLITQVNDTTRSLVSDIIQGGLDDHRTTREIAALIRDATGFSKSRAELIAHTEVGAAYNGAPQEALADLGRATGRTFTKTWSGVLDERERDEHVALEGETVPIDQPFSNGLQYPSEPRCRCTALFNETEAES